MYLTFRLILNQEFQDKATELFRNILNKLGYCAGKTVWWNSYTKLGGHSDVSTVIELRSSTLPDIITEIDSICDDLTMKSKSSVNGGRILIEDKQSQPTHYERVLSTESTPLRYDIIWLQLTFLMDEETQRKCKEDFLHNNNE